MICRLLFCCFLLGAFSVHVLSGELQAQSAVVDKTPKRGENVRQAIAPPDESLIYKTIEDGDDLKLDVFLPPGISDAQKQPQDPALRSAIVLFFGGGWSGGDTRSLAHQARHFADRGMVAFCPQYRTRTSHSVQPKTCLADAKSAMRYVRKNAARWHIDPDKIVAGGGSAGGHLAAATSLLDGFNDPQDEATISCRPCALVLFNPVFDNGPGEYGHKRVVKYWKDFSPAHHIDKDAVPTLAMFGTADKLVSVATAERYRNKMKAAGVRCDVELYPDQPHGFFNFRPAYDQTLARADAFLVELGNLKPPTARPADDLRIGVD